MTGKGPRRGIGERLPAHHIVRMHQILDAPPLPPIPVLDTGSGFPLETLEREEGRAHALLDAATRRVPRTALRSLDAVSRRWLAKWSNAYLPEIDAVARRLGRPGAYFLSVNYEWGCTCQAGPSPDGRTARLVRVLDWATPGLGRNVVAARVGGKHGPFMVLTWPGYTGVLQGMAAGRFSAALNQAPMRRPVGLYPVDWAANRARVWRMPHPMPAHLLREVFETAPTFGEAKRTLAAHPIASPAIFTLAGLAPAETAVIERTERGARVHEGPAAAANHWQACGWRGHARGVDSAGRARRMASVSPELDPGFPWLGAPILNPCTRLAMVADAARGRLVARGWETDGPATAPLMASCQSAVRPALDT